MSNIIMYFLFAYGISFMLVYSNGPFHIFARTREILSGISEQFSELLSCMFCTPTNVGWVTSLFNTFVLTNVNFTPFHILWGDDMVHWFWIMVFDAIVTGAVVYIIDTLQNFFDVDENT